MYSVFPWRRGLTPLAAMGIPQGAKNLLGAETDGFAIDFTDMSMEVRDTTTPANNFSGNPNSKLTYTSPSTKYVLGSDGTYTSGTTLRTLYDASGNALGVPQEEQRINLFLNSRSPATQNVTVSATAYTLSFIGTGSITYSGVASGTLNGTGANDRVTATFTPTAGTLTLTCSGSLDFVQIEAGAFATSPIVTTGSSVTRAIDNIQVPLSIFPYSSTAGTLFVSADKPAANIVSGQASYSAFMSGGSDANTMRHGYRVNASNRFGAFHTISFGGAAETATVVSATPIKTATAYAAASLASVINGGTVATSGSTANTLTSLYLGSRLGSGTQSWNGTIRQVMYVPRRMSNAEIQALTT